MKIKLLARIFAKKKEEDAFTYPKRVLFIFGTRPEAIKLAPLILEMKEYRKDFEVKVAVTGQHRELLDQVLTFFHITPDYDLNIMKEVQTLTGITIECLEGLNLAILDVDPDLVIVQGDTTSAMAGALAAFYRQVPVAHVEAGLRSHDRNLPFPEEMNRRLISEIATYHFAPTEQAVKNLKKEGIVENVWKVGNTGIDAMFIGLANLRWRGKTGTLPENSVLITIHRRENRRGGLLKICGVVKELALIFPGVTFIWPIHPNFVIKEKVKEELGEIENVKLMNPLSYPDMLAIMKNCRFIITDSGGIQEEASSLRKPILVARETTERPEGVKAGTAILVGTDRDKILDLSVKLLLNDSFYESMASRKNPYGDGNSAERIMKAIKEIC
jgi:UDP-N-acetylglucosamine 2-epimerase (non-hydrolysing)